MGIYTLVFFGSMPIGSLLAGNLAEQFGAPATVVFNSAILLLFALYIYWRRPQVRRIG
jgi:MFS-type transporter involved in bile tolerance (Atg22 family)